MMRSPVYISPLFCYFPVVSIYTARSIVLLFWGTLRYLLIESLNYALARLIFETVCHVQLKVPHAETMKFYPKSSGESPGINNGHIPQNTRWCLFNIVQL